LVDITYKLSKTNFITKLVTS